MKRISLILLIVIIGTESTIRLASGLPTNQTFLRKGQTTFQSAKSQDKKVTTDENTSVILPGESIGLLRLGDTESRFLQLFPDRPDLKVYRETSDPKCGTQLHWIDLDPLSLGVIALSYSGTITQIEAGSPRFHTEDGITWGSPPSEVKVRYPGLRAYEAVGTTSEAVGGRNLIFWIDWKRGLAFAFAYSRKSEGWSVYKIVVFQHGAKFCPEGNLPSPDNWRELAPYSLEAPNTRADAPAFEFPGSPSRKEQNQSNVVGSDLMDFLYHGV